MDGTSVTLFGVGAAAVALTICCLAWKPLRAARRRSRERRDMRSFRRAREQLETQFSSLAAAQGKPRGLRWKKCDWQDQVAFARDRKTGLLTALVAVNIHFEAIEDGNMVDVEAVSTVREATAVFHCRGGRWGTGGRALFNMDPHDALCRFEGQFEPISEDSPNEAATGRR